MAVSFTLEAAPTYPAGTLVGAYERLLFAGPPPVAQAPLAVVAATAVVDSLTGLAVFSGLKADRRYYAGAEVRGVWEWVSFTTGNPNENDERARAEAREAALAAELSEIGVVSTPSGSVWLSGESVGGSLAQVVDPGLGFYLKPVQVPNFAGVTRVAGAGQSATLFLKAGVVFHAGGSTFGQSGDNVAIDKHAAHAVSLPLLATDVSGTGYPLVLLADGTAMSWGANLGQLGIGSNNARWVPAYVESGEGQVLTPIKGLSGGHLSGWFVMQDGALRRTGEADLQPIHLYAEEVPTVGATGWGSAATAEKVAGTKGLCMVLLSDGTVRLKGRNNRGQMGDGSFDPTTKPTTEWHNPGLTGVKDVIVSEYNAYTLMLDGTVRCWGRNHRGQVGNGFKDTEAVPTATNQGGAFTGRIDTGSNAVAGKVLTVTAGNANVKVGAIISPGGVLGNTEVVAKLTGTTWEVSKSQLVASTAMEALGPWLITWPLVAGQTQYEVFWRPAPRGGSITASISGTTMTVTGGATRVHIGSTVKGTGVQSGTTVEEQLSASTWRVKVSQTVGSETMEISNPNYLGKNTSPELSGATVEYLATGWPETVMEAKVLGRAPSNVPYDPGLTGVTQLTAGGSEETGGAVGDYYALALLGDGTVKGWGGGNDGEFGDGTRAVHLSPVTVMQGPTGVIGIHACESHAALITTTSPASVVSMRATQVPGTPDVLVEWFPEPGEKVTEWKLEWERVENNPSTNKAEGPKHDSESQTLAGSVTSHTIKGLPLAAKWANATNLMSIKLAARYAQVKPVATCTHVEGHKWRVAWTEINGPSCYDVDSKATGTFPEPGWIIRAREGGPSEAFGHPVVIVQAGTNTVDIEGFALTGVEAQVEGSWLTLWQTRSVEAIPGEMPAEVPWLIAPPSVKVNTAYRKPKTNVKVISEPILSVNKGPKPEEWVVSWPQIGNAKGQLEAGWVVRWKPNPQTDWAEAQVSPVQPALVGTQTYVIPEAFKTTPEAQVYGTRAGVGDVVQSVPGEWANATASSPRIYQWFRQALTEGGSEPIAGATSSTYQLQPVDAGYALRVMETPSNAVGAANVVTKLKSQGRFIGAPSYAAVPD